MSKLHKIPKWGVWVCGSIVNNILLKVVYCCRHYQQINSLLCNNVLLLRPLAKILRKECF